MDEFYASIHQPLRGMYCQEKCSRLFLSTCIHAGNTGNARTPTWTMCHSKDIQRYVGGRQRMERVVEQLPAMSVGHRACLEKN